MPELLIKDNRDIRLRPLLLRMLLLCIVTRPLIDLTGKYDEGGLINVGGIYGMIFCMVCYVYAIANMFEKNKAGMQVLLHLFMLLILYMIALYNSSDAYFTSIARFVVGFSAVVLILPVKSGQYIELYSKWLLGIAMIPVIIAWLQLFGLYDFSYYDYLASSTVGRPSGGYFQPSSLTRTLLFCIIITYLVVKAKNYICKYSLIFMYILTIFISGHRTSLIIAFVIIAMLEVTTTLIKRLPTLIVLSTAGLAAVIYYLRDKLTVYLDLFLVIFSDSGINFRGREQIWSQSWEIYSQFSSVQKLVGYGYPMIEPHNELLRILLTNGLLGVLIYVVLFGSLFRFVYVRVSKFGRRALSTTFVYFILFGITLEPASYPNYMWLFFFTLTVILNIHKKEVLAID